MRRDDGKDRLVSDMTTGSWEILPIFSERGDDGLKIKESCHSFTVFLLVTVFCSTTVAQCLEARKGTGTGSPPYHLHPSRISTRIPGFSNICRQKGRHKPVQRHDKLSQRSRSWPAVRYRDIAYDMYESVNLQ